MNSDATQFLFENAKIHMEAQSSQEFVEKFSNLFKIYFGIDKIDFLTLDYNTGIFRDFVKDWIYINDPEQQRKIGKIFEQFQKRTDIFVFNNRIFEYKLTDEEIEESISLKNPDLNVAYFPIFSPTRTFGVIKIEFKDLRQGIEINREFFDILQIIFMQISVSIYNRVIQEHMATGLNFYDAMKNIAKIIENQYELEYIIPQIGEMIDRFISSHLIYIFLKNDDGQFRLIWPTNCNNEEIFKMLQQVDDKVIISEDHRIGVFPINGEETKLGALVAYSTIGKLTENEIDYIIELTKQSGITIQRANVYSEVLKHATLDALTGLNNRRQFEIRLKQETAQSIRKNTDLCGLMLDIDYFKRVNDTYGHAAGDCVIRGIAEIISKTIREYDIACRYGGEEFFVLLPMTKIEDTLAVAQRIRQNIQNTKIDIREAKVKGVPYLQVTASLGINYFDKKVSAEEFYQGADKALYQSKVNGRNRVTVYEESMTKSDN